MTTRIDSPFRFRKAELRRERRRRRRNAVVVTTAVAATAVVGSVAVRPDSAWFRGLTKPDWYPPAKAFPIAWTALYAALAWSGTRALNRAPKGDRRKVACALGTNLSLNAAWTWTFFRVERTELALATILALDVSNVCLIRRFGKHDPLGAVAQVPYAAWTGFATALTEEIWINN